MAKRFESINKIGPAKKIKLDVSVTHGPFHTTSSNIVDFWANDDDDDILMATQLAEKKQHQTGINNESEFNFNQFSSRAHGTTSTQQLIVEPTQSFQKSSMKPMGDLFPIGISTPWNVEEICGMDDTSVFLPDQKKSVKDPLYEGQSSSKNSSASTAIRRQLAQERQLKYLTERYDWLKKVNAKLEKDLQESTNSVVMKDGEVNILRDELRQARKLLQANKMEKMSIAEEVGNESNEKVLEAFKQVIAKDTELNYTNVEVFNHKIRNAKCTIKDSSPSTESDVYKCRNLLRIENLLIERSSSTNNYFQTDGNVYQFVKETSVQDKPRNAFEIELKELLLYNAQLQSHSSADDTIVSCIMTSVRRVFTEFWIYANSLELPQHSIACPNHHFNLQLDHGTSARRSIIQSEALFNQERAILVRRYIATLALICRKHCNVSNALLIEKHNNYLIIKIAIQAIIKISYSFEVYEHFGILEATGALLHSLLGHVTLLKFSTYENQQQILFDLLKQLVFACPSPWVFRELSSCMLLCTQQTQMMAKMCVNSPKNCFVSDRVRHLYNFMPKACLIQVYAGLLEQCFCTHLPLQPNHFKLLLSLCGNHVRFVYQCFTVKPKSVLKMLPFSFSVGNEKEQSEDTLPKVSHFKSDVTFENNTIANINGSTLSTNSISALCPLPVKGHMPHDGGCECYVRLCISVLTLVFQTMYHWMRQNKKDIPEVAGISHIAVHLLTLIFCEYFVPCVFRDSEDTTKHYLSLLCNWWTDQSQLLNFSDIHLRCLRQLQELHLMLKPLHQEGNPCNSSNEFSEWTQVLKGVDAKILTRDQVDV
ncbi:hypothetical protein KR222_008145, partial [Zaprionus bogoriensis]